MYMVTWEALIDLLTFIVHIIMLIVTLTKKK